MVSADPFFNSRRDQIITLAVHHKILDFYTAREFASAGGLMSYGPDIANSYQQAGGYAARILKGEKPGELPVCKRRSLSLSSI